MQTIVANNHDEWLKLRSTGIGSSEVATILNLNPFETSYQLWLRKTCGAEAKAETPLMAAGHLLEQAVAELFTSQTGATIEKGSETEFIVIDTENDYMRVSPDRYFSFADTPSERCILECKTTQKDIDPDNIPQYWYIQLQYQMSVANVNRGALAWLTRGYKFGYQEYARNDIFCDYLREKVKAFWEQNIKQGIEPSPTTPEDIALKYPSHSDGKEKIITPTVFEAISKLKETKEQISALEKVKEENEKIIRAYFEDSERLVDDTGHVFATFRNAKDSERFDTTRFAQEHPDLYSQYLKIQSGSRRLLIK